MGNLVLSRKIDEAIIIGEGETKVIIRIEAIQGNNYRVKLAIDAPIEVPIHREEIWNEIYGDGKE